jgi:hypothetical protein
VELKCEHHFPFSTISHESYPPRVWFSLLGLQEKVKWLMSHKHQQQICIRSTTMAFSLESWRFLVRSLDPVIQPVPYNKSRTMVHHFCDLSTASVSTIERNKELFYCV